MRFPIIALLSTLAFSQTIFATDLPSSNLKMSDILQNLQRDNNMLIKEIEFNDKQYEAKAINSDGSKVDLEISPQTGEILKPKDEIHKISILQAAQNVEKAGYLIYKIEASKKEYDVKAYKQDKKYSLKVNAETGVVKE